MTPIKSARLMDKKFARLIGPLRRAVAKERNRYISAVVAQWKESRVFDPALQHEHAFNLFDILAKHYRRIFNIAPDIVNAATPKLALAGAKKGPRSFDFNFSEFLTQNGMKKANAIAGTAAADVQRLMRAAIEAEEPEAVVIRRGLRARGLTPYRADTIARTEIGLAAAYAMKRYIAERERDLGLKNMTKQWVPVSDDRTREAHTEMEGSAPIANSERFFVGGEWMDGPKDPSASPENVINCRCQLVYDFDL